MKTLLSLLSLVIQAVVTAIINSFKRDEAAKAKERERLSNIEKKRVENALRSEADMRRLDSEHPDGSLRDDGYRRD